MDDALRSPNAIPRRTLLGGALGLAIPSPTARPVWTRLAQDAGSEPAVPDGPTVPSGQPRPDAQLTIGSTRDPVSLHPWEATEAAAFDLLAGVVEGLLKVNAAGRLQPALAEGFTLSDDSLSYTFRLREGVVFHNGEPFAGRAVAAAWEARLDGTLSGAATLGWDRISAINVPDERTVEIVTREPYAPFLSTVGIAPIVPASAYDDGLDAFRERYAVEPIGTGPFRLKSWQPGDALTLERWDEYWGGPALLAAIRYQLLIDDNAVPRALAAGQIAVAGGVGGLTIAEVKDALALPDVQVWQHVTRTWQHLDLKQIGFLRERNVRQALDYATPRQAIIDDLLLGRALPAFADQMPGSWAAHETLGARPFDPGRARDLLESAGFRPDRDGVLARGGEPFRIELWGVADDPLARRILDTIAREWAALGLAVLVRTAEPETLWGPTGYQFTDAMTACLYAWTNSIDPDDLFYWHSSQIPSAPTAPGSNLPAFFYPFSFQTEIDALTATAASTLDLEERRDLYVQIQELLAREVPVIFLYWEEAFPAARQEVGGFWPNPYTGLLWNAQEWYLADADVLGTPSPAATPRADG